MPLVAGQTLTHYEILGSLGAGGMGEVYRARDTRLEREVAIKVLPERFADDEERLRRFEREAKTLASLNHANLAHVYGIDQVGDTCFLAMELVAGEDLAERLARGALSIDEAIDVCRQIAEGLEAAHEAGVVHRDLKPANVRVTPEGVVKILDFGLAKPIRPKASSGSGTTTAQSDSFSMTEEGLVLGTPTYMSPEQARGRQVDRRTDIWAFGCVLYECLTGERAFRGETIADVIASVLDESPDPSALPRNVPPGVRDVLERALEKDARSRLRDIGEARVRLERARDQPVVASAGASSRGVSVPLAALVLLLVALVAAFLGRSLGIATEAGNEGPLRKMVLASEAGPLHEAVLSPEGTHIAIVAGGRLSVRDLTELEAHELPDTEGARFVLWSPDGSELAYLQGRRLWRSDLEGRRRERISDLDGTWVSGAGAHWTEDDRIVFSNGSSHLFEVPSRGGEARILLESADIQAEHYHDPCVLPAAAGIVFATHGATGTDTLELVVNGERTVLLRYPGEFVDNPSYSSSGHILFTRGPDPAGIWALPFSLAGLAATGEAFQVSPNGTSPSLSRDGSLLYRGGSSSLVRGLVWVDREGQVVGEVGEPLSDPRGPRLSPDGRWVVVSAYEEAERHLWLVDVERGARRQLTFGDDTDADPAWQDDRRVLFTRSGEEGVRACAIDIDTGEVEVLSGRRGGQATRDGRYRVYHDYGEIRLDDGDGEPEVFHDTSGESFSWPVLSPREDFVVFKSDATALGSIVLRRFPSGAGQWQLHSEGGNWLRWSPSGDELFFSDEGGLYAMEIEAGDEVTFDAPRRLFSENDQGLITGLGYDVDREGERILCLRPERLERPTMTLVQGWYSEFEPAPGG